MSLTMWSYELTNRSRSQALPPRGASLKFAGGEMNVSKRDSDSLKCCDFRLRCTKQRLLLLCAHFTEARLELRGG